MSFMQVGHTRCLVDGNFGLIKKFYRSSDVDTVHQLKNVTNNSAQSKSTRGNRGNGQLVGHPIQANTKNYKVSSHHF